MLRCGTVSEDFTVEVTSSNFTKELHPLMDLFNQSQILYHIKAQELHCIQTRKKPTVACRPVSFLNFWLHPQSSKIQTFLNPTTTITSKRRRQREEVL